VLFLNNVRADRTPALPSWKLSAFVYRLETSEILLRLKLVLTVPPVLQEVHQLLTPSVRIGVFGKDRFCLLTYFNYTNYKSGTVVTVTTNIRLLSTL